MPPVTIYTKPFCPYCSRALKLLRDKSAFDANKKRAMVQRTGGGSTFPQIFIGERHVGGCDDLMSLERRGELDKLLAA